MDKMISRKEMYKEKNRYSMFEEIITSKVFLSIYSKKKEVKEKEDKEIHKN